MKSILLNLYLKCFMKFGQNTLRCPLSESFTNSLLEYQRVKKLNFINRRSLSTVGSLDNLTQPNVRKATKNENSIIYCGSLTYQVKGVKMFTCISSLGGIIIQPWMLQNILKGNNLPLGMALFCCVGFFTFITPFLIHLLTKKYVTEIWYNSATDTYTATVLSFFLRRIDINFKIEDVQIPSALPIFSTMYIKGRPVFVISDSFLEVEHYIRMMRYDKPIDLNLNDITHAPNDNKK